MYNKISHLREALAKGCCDWRIWAVGWEMCARLWEMCGFELVHGQTSNAVEEYFLPDRGVRFYVEKFVWCEIANVYAGTERCVFPRKRQGVESDWEYNERYTYFRERVARPETVCYINQVSERHCVVCARGKKVNPRDKSWHLKLDSLKKAALATGLENRGQSAPVGSAVIAEPPEKIFN